MNEPYVRCARHLSWLVEAVERVASEQPAGATIDAERLLDAVPDRIPSGDEVAVVLKAFESLGVLRKSGGRLVLDRGRLAETTGYRDGVRDALLEFGSIDPKPADLCVTVPPDLGPAAESDLRTEAIDLRAALIDVLASAKRRLVVASPFWDAEAALDIAEFLARRLEAGVQVGVLGRGRAEDGAGFELLESRLSLYSACRFYSWYEPSSGARFGAQTFHFKAAAADDGARGYLGSANLTTSGLRSRMELGVILSGDPARRLSRILDVVLSFARRTPARTA